MKKNTKKILFILSDVDGDQVKITLKTLREIFSNLSDGGFRSWLFQLEKQQLIYIDRVPERAYASLTSKGERLVRDLFPALDPQWEAWHGEWQLLLFLQAPSGDKQFRYLRQMVLQERGMPLARGAYLIPGAITRRLHLELQLKYADSVALCVVKDWVFGLEKPVILSYYDVTERASLYSSVSKEIDRLLTQNDTQKGLIKKHKELLYSELDRLFELVQDDPGFTHYYSPEVTSARAVLSKIHQLLAL